MGGGAPSSFLGGRAGVRLGAGACPGGDSGVIFWGGAAPLGRWRRCVPTAHVRLPGHVNTLWYIIGHSGLYTRFFFFLGGWGLQRPDMRNRNGWRVEGGGFGGCHLLGSCRVQQGGAQGGCRAQGLPAPRAGQPPPRQDVTEAGCGAGCGVHRARGPCTIRTHP